ncbi:MAG: T9SS type A sorting domain-containing protein [Bacteroidales bacterium]|nr:T9SS type A sorting domain-containing protein [Bacteroidales bacterium]
MAKKLYSILIILLTTGFLCSPITAGIHYAEDSIQTTVLSTHSIGDHNLAVDTFQNRPWFSEPYPNPIKDFITLDYKIPVQNKTAQIRISDLTGKTLKVLNLDSFGRKIRINMSSFNKGMYFLSIYYNGSLIKSNTLILGANN